MKRKTELNIILLIPVHNHLDHTKRCLEGLTSHLPEIPGHVFRIILVDDGSTDGTYEWVDTNYSDIILLKGDGNLWWSGAVNKGAKHALENLEADYIVLWNNDIQFREDYFENLIRILTELPADTIIGSKIMIREKPELVWSMGGIFNPRTGLYSMIGYYKPDSPGFQQIAEVDWLTGMGTIIPAAVLRAIGYWDNARFPQYHGDSDFTYRAKIKGFSIIVHPSLVLYNSVLNSGIEHGGNVKNLIRLITDIRSKSNLKKNFMFYSLYAKSPLAYLPLISLYFKIFGGFIKWKIMALFGIKKPLIKA